VKQRADRILTTHVGSLPRPKDLLDLMKAKVTGLAYERSTGASFTSFTSNLQIGGKSTSLPP